MHRTGFFHHIGTFLLLAATILLIVVDISAPVVNHISLLTVNLANISTSRQSSVTFGTFGHCILDVAPGSGQSDFCSRPAVGYRPTDVMFEVDGTQFDGYQEDLTHALTKVMILHPVATGICFIAFLLSLGAGVVGSLVASMLAALAFVTTLVVLITDFVLWGLVKVEVNDDGTGSRARFGVAIWLVLVAAICTFLATFVVLFTCCSARIHRRREVTKEQRKTDGYAPPPRSRRWWQRR